MELDKLKIPEHKELPKSNSTKLWSLVAVGVVVGIIIGRSSVAPVIKEVPVSYSDGPSDNINQPISSFVSGGWIEPASPLYPVQVASKISEVVEEIFVKEGDVLKPGMVIAKLYDADLRSNYIIKEAELESALVEFEKLKAGYRVEDIKAAKAQYDAAIAKMTLAESEYNRAVNLRTGTISELEMDTIKAKFAELKARAESAQANYELLKSGPRREDIIAAEAKRNLKAATFELAKRRLSYAEVRAPESIADLTVLSVDAHIGVGVKAGQAIIKLYDAKKMEVRLDVPQTKITNVKLNGLATVTTDADPNHKYRGRVIRIEPKAVIAKNTITVRVRIENPDDKLFPDMVAQVNFINNDAPEDN